MEGNKGVGDLGQAHQEEFYFLVYCPLKKLLHESTIFLHTGMISLYDGKSLGGTFEGRWRKQETSAGVCEPGTVTYYLSSRPGGNIWPFVSSTPFLKMKEWIRNNQEVAESEFKSQVA